ncbi:MAG: lytic transglycosylase domain-containing protein [Actinomycetota bacterium]
MVIYMSGIWSRTAAGRSVGALVGVLLALALSLALNTFGGGSARAAEARDSAPSISGESSLAVVNPESGAEQVSQPLAEARLVVATEVLTSGKLTALNLSTVAQSAYLVKKAKTRNGARSVGKLLAEENYGWSGKQWQCLDKLWIKESQWTYTSHNKRTGAHGIPQAYPATKYEYMGSDWRKNPVTQIMWGLKYIDVRYGTPCKALNTFYRTRMY